jgi:TctA family transporter
MIGMFAISEVLRWVTSSRQVQSWRSARSATCSGASGPCSSATRSTCCAAPWSAPASASCPGPAPTSRPGSPTRSPSGSRRSPEKFGKGHIEGIVDAGTANNASLGGAWVPALVFGIPGDSITAIVIGVLYMKKHEPRARR